MRQERVRKTLCGLLDRLQDRLRGERDIDVRIGEIGFERRNLGNRFGQYPIMISEGQKLPAQTEGIDNRIESLEISDRICECCRLM